jgi:peptidoglycan/xylan/chitin deacetylase (PgdA/CDA1 family)
MRSLRRRVVLPFALVAGVGLFACATPRVFTRIAAGLTPSVSYFVPTEQRVVALTIDDGPDPEATPRILEVLDRHDARATFFLIGNQIQGNEALLGKMRDHGHELANHTFRERASIGLPGTQLARDLERTDALLRPFGAVEWFRPGSGAFTPAMLDLATNRGYRTALGDVYPLDAWVPSSRFHSWYILRSVRPGSIVVLHDSKGRGQRTAETLDRVLPALRERGFRVVTLSELASAAK